MSYIHPGSLSSLFNTLPRHSALRFPVYKTLVELASSNDELYVLQVSRIDVENWLKEWDITPTEKSAFLKTLVDAFSKASQSYVHIVPSPFAPIQPSTSSIEQRYGLSLQTRARALVRTDIAVDTACRAGRNRHGLVESSSVRL